MRADTQGFSSRLVYCYFAGKWYSKYRSFLYLLYHLLISVRKTFLCLPSHMVEHAAVNRRVVGSSPTWGANQDTVWFYHTVSWFIKTKGLEPVRSRRLQERERNEARLDKPSMQRALTRDSLHNLRCHVAASLFGLPLFRMKKRLRISDCRSFSQKVTLAQAC